MRPKRVDCADCANFVYPDWMISFDIIKLTKEEKEKCKLGKRVMFRMKGGPDFESGWPRYCADFKAISTIVSDDA